MESVLSSLKQAPQEVLNRAYMLTELCPTRELSTLSETEARALLEATHQFMVMDWRPANEAH